MLNLKDPKVLTLAGAISGITLLLGFTQWGFVPLPTPAGAATIMHLPTIIGGIVLGPLFGGLVGLIFGLITVLYFSHIAPFWVLIPARPFIGIVSGLVYLGLYDILGKSEKRKVYSSFVLSLIIFLFLFWLGNKYLSQFIYIWLIVDYLISVLCFQVLKDKNPEIVSISIASFLGSWTNTVGTLGLAVLFGVFNFETALSVAILHGVPESILAVIVCTPTSIAIRRFLRREV
ncbi:MAG: ECF transporter S component [Dictyoglomus sp. NZ13-RE01]|nr:MAG: ECF transporter S component [Dictyoglomus sp. NZ13-RE01]